jgi:hypothetical protein
VWNHALGCRLCLLEDSPIMAAFDKIPLIPQKLLCRMRYGIPAIRNYDRHFRFAF